MSEVEREYRTEYHTTDKSSWGPGPWTEEPDWVQWVDPSTGLDCLALRNDAGAWCGYVGVPDDHPWYGVDYSDCPQSCGKDWCDHRLEVVIDVHGGITWSGTISFEPFPGRPERVWWFGFDCCHLDDLVPEWFFLRGSTYRDLDYVRNECARMAEQLARVARETALDESEGEA